MKERVTRLISDRKKEEEAPLCRLEAQFRRRMASSRTCLAAAFAATILPPAAGLVSSPHLHVRPSSLPTPCKGVAASSAASSRSQAITSVRRAAEEDPGSNWLGAGADENGNEHGSPSASSSSRRGALRAASAGILAAASAIFSSAASASAAAEVGVPKDGGTMGPKSSGMAGGSADPFKQTFQRGISKRSDRLYGCATQKNCVSSAAVKNPSQFSAPWDYTISTPDAAQAWRRLKAEIEADSSLKLIEADESKLYIRAEGTSKVPATGIDDVEFLLIPDQKILTYRSASRENVYVCELRLARNYRYASIYQSISLYVYMYIYISNPFCIQPSILTSATHEHHDLFPLGASSCDAPFHPSSYPNLLPRVASPATFTCALCLQTQPQTQPGPRTVQR